MAALPPNHPVMLSLWKWHLLLPPATWCSNLAAAFQHILRWKTVSSTSWQRALVSPRAHDGERKASDAAKKGQKWKRIKKESQDEELAAEGMPYEAGEFCWTGLTSNPWFSAALLLQSSPTLSMTKPLFYQILDTPRSLNHHTSSTLRTTPINLYIFESCKDEVSNLFSQKICAEMWKLAASQSSLAFAGLQSSICEPVGLENPNSTNLKKDLFLASKAGIFLAELASPFADCHLGMTIVVKSNRGGEPSTACYAYRHDSICWLELELEDTGVM